MDNILINTGYWEHNIIEKIRVVVEAYYLVDMSRVNAYETIDKILTL